MLTLIKLVDGRNNLIVNREKNIDILKCIAIIIVVLGHSLIIYNPNWGLYKTTNNSLTCEVIEKIINIIQMPLYFAISGYLFVYAKKQGYKDFIIKKIKRLIIPFVLISLLYLLPIRYLLQYNNYVENSFLYNVIINIICGKDNGHLWFLPSLFIIFSIFYWLKDKSKNTNTIIFLILIICSYLCNYTHSYFSRVCQFSMYFWIGYLINTYKKEKSTNIIIIIFSIFIINLIGKIIFAKDIFDYYIKCSISMIICLILFKIKWVNFKDKKYLNRIIDIISKNSYGIYLFHSPLIYFTFKYLPNINPLYIFVINFFGFGFIALMITIIMRKIKCAFLIGEGEKKKYVKEERISN